MRKIILSVVALVGSASYGQDIIQTIATETCSCIKDKKLDLEKVSGQQLEGDFAGCFFNSYNAHIAEVEKIEKLDFSDEEQMGKFGEKVAMKMLGICPDVILAMGRADDQGVTPAATMVQTVEGEVIDIKMGDFVTIIVKDKNGRTHNLMLLNYFDSSSLFTDNQIKKKDKISASYSEIDMYDPKAKEFRYYKVISGLEKK
jgi:hypothetical protein